MRGGSRPVRPAMSARTGAAQRTVICRPREVRQEKSRFENIPQPLVEFIYYIRLSKIIIAAYYNNGMFSLFVCTHAG